MAATTNAVAPIHALDRDERSRPAQRSAAAQCDSEWCAPARRPPERAAQWSSPGADPAGPAGHATARQTYVGERSGTGQPQRTAVRRHGGLRVTQQVSVAGSATRPEAAVSRPVRRANLAVRVESNRQVKAVIEDHLTAKRSPRSPGIATTVPIYGVPPAGFEPAPPPPEGGALSPELRGLRDLQRLPGVLGGASSGFGAGECERGG
jgi:hypothetical protein